MPLTLSPRTHGRASTDTPTPPPADRGRVWLARLLAGDDVLPPVDAAALPPADRPAVEHDAAARAVGCRDLFLIDAPERPARERVLADVARAAALRGERVLILSPDPAAADRLVELLAHAVSVVRALSDDENPYRPSPVVTRLTSANAGAAHADKLIREAAAPVAALEAKLAPLATLTAVLADLRERVDRFEQAERERAELAATPDPLATARAGQAAAIASLTTDRDATSAKRREKEEALAAARQHAYEPAEAVKKPGFLARLLGKKATDAHDPERYAAELEREVKELALHEAKLTGELDALAATSAAEFARLAAAQQERDAKLAALTAEAQATTAAFAAHRAAFEAAGFAAPWPTPQSVESTSSALAEARDRIEQELAAARGRHAELSAARGELVRSFLGGVKVVVGTPGCLHADAAFAPPSEPFGLLVLDHAEELGEQDFANLARLAERWVLAGDAGMPEEPKPHVNGAGRPARNGRPAPPSLAARLARLLDREPWAAEADRLVCRLAPVAPEQRRGLFREPVVDDPNIELRFAADADGMILAEVAFPRGTDPSAAKAFVHRHLGDVLLRPCGELAWHHAADRVTACWSAAECGSPEAWVEYEPGVRERVVGTGAAAFTAAVSFDAASGWDAEKAAAWLADRLPAASACRLAVLPRDPTVPSGTTPRGTAVGV